MLETAREPQKTVDLPSFPFLFVVLQPVECDEGHFVKAHKEKKPQGIKHKIHEERERAKRRATAIFLAFILIAMAALAIFAYTSLNQSQNSTINSGFIQSRAAIVDQASLSPSMGPNQAFTETTTNILKQAGYAVDYFPGEQVTVEFYRNLPMHGYRLIILRVHSSAALVEGKDFVEAPVSFFTCEEYNRSKYVSEQLSDQLLIASYAMPGPPYYFGITPKFVTSSMNGNFNDTVVIMMGCEGLNNTKMAKAFVEKGAKAYIGWKGTVSASHTDWATINLLQHLVTEKQSIGQAVENTLKEVGADPTYGSVLSYYPVLVQHYTIGDSKCSARANAVLIDSVMMSYSGRAKIPIEDSVFELGVLGEQSGREG